MIDTGSSHKVLGQAALIGLIALGGCGDDAAGVGTGYTGAGSEDTGDVDSSGTEAVDETGGDPCANGVKDGDETDVDCGAVCDNKCGSGQGCATDEDCEEGTVCTDSGVCGQDGGGNCEDGAQTDDETDVDCGGSCPDPCGDGQGCLVNADCQSGVCSQHVCQAPACDDNVQNGDETDVDCGGSCPGCGNGSGCVEADDCQSGVCIDDQCAPATCADGVLNGNETDVDCGGSCGSTCETGENCLVGLDCISLVCDPLTTTCSARACDDGIKNGDETDRDCGGACGATCKPGEDCLVDGDCTSLVCGPSNVCSAPACDDGIKNGDETDVDCGGSCGSTCEDGEDCLVGLDCISLICDQNSNTCATATCDDGVKNGNETDTDCGGSCPGCDEGEDCLVDQDCLSGSCDEDDLVCNPSVWVTAAPACSDYAGQPVQLTAVAMGGTGNYTYSWSPQAGLDDPFSATPLASPSGFQTYTVTVDDGVNTAEDTVTVVDNQPFDLQNNCTLYGKTFSQNAPPATITYQDMGTKACENGNNNFGLHLCEGVVFEEVLLTGEMGVGSTNDDDWIGLVWGAQDNANFYSLVWKGGLQFVPEFSCSAPEGILVKRIESPDFDSLLGEDFYCNSNTPRSTVLAAPFQTTQEGWEPGENYRVEIVHSATGSDIQVTRLSDNVVIANFSINDTTFPSGYFGSTTLSQGNACVGPLFASCQ